MIVGQELAMHVGADDHSPITVQVTVPDVVRLYPMLQEYVTVCKVMAVVAVTAPKVGVIIAEHE